MRRGPHDGEERDADVDARLIEVEDRGEELAADHLLQHVQLQQEEGDPCGGGSRSPLRERCRHQELELTASCNHELDAGTIRRQAPQERAPITRPSFTWCRRSWPISCPTTALISSFVIFGRIVSKRQMRRNLTALHE